MKFRKVKNSETREEPMIVLQDMIPNPRNAPPERKPTHRRKENARRQRSTFEGKPTHRRKEKPPLNTLTKEKDS